MVNQNDTFSGNDYENNYDPVIALGHSSADNDTEATELIEDNTDIQQAAPFTAADLSDELLDPVIALDDSLAFNDNEATELIVDTADLQPDTVFSADERSGDLYYIPNGLESEPYFLDDETDARASDFLVSAFTPANPELYHYSDEDMNEEDADDDEQTRQCRTDDSTNDKWHRILVNLINGLLTFWAIMGLIYLALIYSPTPRITKLRNMYISTAMSTLSHKYLATAIIPSEIIDDLLRTQYEADANAVGLQSTWGNVQVQALQGFSNDSDTSADAADTAENKEDTAAGNPSTISEGDSGKERTYSCEEEKQFFQLFPELDYDSVQNYLASNPDALSNGWSYIDINEAGLDDSGTSMITTYGDEVLAVNADQGVILIRMYINSSRGILAICKDTSRLSLCPASTLGTIGQTAGNICEANDGVLGLTGSAFMDDGTGNGGQISGLAVCSGSVYGSALGGSDKRLELRNDDRMYIVDSVADVNSDTRDACEFRPALIIDGEVVVDDSCGWTSPNPRAVLGQSARLETMFFVLEGRYVDSPGDSVVNIAYLMQKYGCVQAMNLDGGTSAIMYYDGEYVTRCSNSDLPGGRTLPTAWVYRRS